MPPSVARHTDIAAFLLLLGLGLTLYFPILDLLPLRSDNLYVLAWVDHASIANLLGLDPAIYPEWRPLAYQTIWLEHSIIQLRQVGFHHFVNLLLWVTCAWLVYRLVDELASSRAWAFTVAALLVVDSRAAESLIWIVERQSTLACCLGLLACLIVVRARQRTLSPATFIGVTVLLLGAALGKEYGLAFAAALILHGALSRRADLAAAGTVAAVTYGALRLTLADGALGTYCEDMGYFFVSRHFCFDSPAGPGLRQMAYNIGANGIGMALPGLFNNEGRIRLHIGGLGLSSLMLAATVRGVWFGDRRLRLLAMVPAFNALLGFLVYRDRNQLIGICALAVAAGVGLANWRLLADARRRYPALHLAAAVLLFALLARHAVGTRAGIEATVADLLAQDPCQSAVREREFGDEFAKRVKATYGLSNPDCLEAPSAY